MGTLSVGILATSTALSFRSSCNNRDPSENFPFFQNISAAAPSVLGQQDTLWGMEEGHIYDLLFQNVRIGGKLVDSVEHFLTNQYVYDIKFAS